MRTLKLMGLGAAIVIVALAVVHYERFSNTTAAQIISYPHQQDQCLKDLFTPETQKITIAFSKDHYYLRQDRYNTKKALRKAHRDEQIWFRDEAPAWWPRKFYSDLACD